MLTYQYYRDNPEEFAKYRGKDLVPFTCCRCSALYHKKQRTIRQAILYKLDKLSFCSKECQTANQFTAVTEQCANCQKLVTRRLAERKSVKNVFCNSSCAASYNNRHKKHGTRRSKLEVYLEEQLRLLYPTLEIIACGTAAIEAELDLYFPELRFAIELNGPTHYEPIYGQNKFQRIQQNDKQKLIRCYERGIELMVIDVSKVTHINAVRKEHFLVLVRHQLDSIMGRKNEPLPTNNDQ